jgi:hypothetical protein
VLKVIQGQHDKPKAASAYGRNDRPIEEDEEVCQGNIFGLKSKHLHISVFTTSLITVFSKNGFQEVLLLLSC